MAARIPYISHAVTVVPAGAATAAVLYDNVVDGGTHPEPPGEYSEWKRIDGAKLSVAVAHGYRVNRIYCTSVTKVKALDIGSMTKFIESESRLSRDISFGEGSQFESDLPSVQGVMTYAWDGSEYPGHYYLRRDTLSCIEGITVECVPVDGSQTTVFLNTSATAGGVAVPRIDAKHGTPGSFAIFSVEARPNPGFRFVSWEAETSGVVIALTGALTATVSYPFPTSGQAYISVIAKFESTVGPHPFPPPTPDPDNPYPPDDPWNPDDPMTRKYGYIIVRTRPDDSANGSTEPTEAIYAGMPGQYQKIRIVATANDGYSFLKWTDEYGADVATSEVYEQTLQFPGEGERTYLTFVGNFFNPSGDKKLVIVTANTGPYPRPYTLIDMTNYGADVQPHDVRKYGLPGETLRFDFIAYSEPKLGTWFREWNTRYDRNGTTLGTDRAASIPFLVTNAPSPQSHAVFACYDSTGIVTVCCAFVGKLDSFYVDKHCLLGQALASTSGPAARSLSLPKTAHGKRSVYTSTDPNPDAHSVIRAWCSPRDGFVGVKVIERWYEKNSETGEITTTDYETPWDEDFERPTIGYETEDPGPIWSGYIETQIIFVLRHPGTGKILHGANKKILHGAAGSVLYDD